MAGVCLVDAGCDGVEEMLFSVGFPDGSTGCCGVCSDDMMLMCGWIELRYAAWKQLHFSEAR